MTKAPPREISGLQEQYAQRAASAARVVDCLRVQLSALIDNAAVTLGVPMESRVKSWQSVSDKLERADSDRLKIDHVQDIAGLRLILLFVDDIPVIDKLIKDNLDIIEYEDTSTRLDDDRFGYNSNHYTVRIPAAWAQIPSYSGIAGEVAEIQVRTVAQHIWAAASHKLQYKSEVSVPRPLRRSINRVSALLETVDLELSRIVSERAEYKTSAEVSYSEEERLNVDLLEQVLSEIYPNDNREKVDPDTEEGLDRLLQEFISAGIEKPKDLKDLLIPHLDWALKRDAEQAKKADPEEYKDLDLDWERIQRGLFYNQIGLARITLNKVLRSRN